MYKIFTFMKFLKYSYLSITFWKKAKGNFFLKAQGLWILIITQYWNPCLFLGGFWDILSYLFPNEMELLSPLLLLVFFLLQLHPTEAARCHGLIWGSEGEVVYPSLPQNNKTGFAFRGLLFHSFPLYVHGAMPKTDGYTCPTHIWVNSLIYLIDIQSSYSQNMAILTVRRNVIYSQHLLYHQTFFSMVITARSGLYFLSHV